MHPHTLYGDKIEEVLGPNRYYLQNQHVQLYTKSCFAGRFDDDVDDGGDDDADADDDDADDDADDDTDGDDDDADDDDADGS